MVALLNLRRCSIAVACALAAVECIAASPVRSLCNAREQIVFSCVTAPHGKTASLCASEDLRAGRGYVVYRFGRQDKIEFEYPKQHEGSRTEFFYSHYSRALVDRSEVRFDNGGYRYELFDYYEEENGKPSYRREIDVSRTDGQSPALSLACASGIVSRLDLVADVVPCDPESDLGVGCPH